MTIKQLLINLLGKLAETSGWVEIDCSPSQPLANGAHTQWLNVVWYAVREGYCRPRPESPVWDDTIKRMERSVKLSSIIPRDVEQALARGVCQLMLLPRGEMRLRALQAEAAKTAKQESIR